VLLLNSYLSILVVHCHRMVGDNKVTGLMYYFEAFDEYLNGKNYPDPEIETPYFVIESWNPVTGRR